MIATTNQSHVLRGGSLPAGPAWDGRTRDDAAESFLFCLVILMSPPLTASGLTPGPVAHIRHVVAISLDVLPVLDELVSNRLLGVRGRRAEPRNTLDHVGHEVKAIELVPHDHVERRGRGPFLFVSVHVKVVVI